MKHVIYALLALCLVLSDWSIAEAQSKRLIISSPITGGEVQVSLQDLGKMNWKQATEACANLGNGWRLPTKEELLLMYEELHLKGKGDFAEDYYWSASQAETRFGEINAWAVHFAESPLGLNLGKAFYGDPIGDKANSNRVRAVRDLD
jgi:hypothetical protein